MAEPTASVLLGLGANLGDPIRQLSDAVSRLAGVITPRSVSTVYRTEPVGHRDQPDFYNLVLTGATRLPPEALLERCREVEAALGRTRTFANAPRTLDVDLLAYGDLVLDEPALTLPHPRMHQRGFVLVPLVEVAPEWRHPVLGRSALELLQELGSTAGVRAWGVLPEARGCAR